MSRGWEKSNLTVGEELRLPTSLFIEPDKALDRFVSARYVGETESFLIFDFEFKPLFGKTENLHYTRCVTWASIWCGAVKIYRDDNTQIRARRQEGLPLAIGQQSSEI